MSPPEAGSSTILNPATEEVVEVVPHTSASATDEAIARAKAASPAWRAVAPGDQARLLRRFAEAVDADVDRTAALEVANSRAHDRQRPMGGRQRRDVLHYYAAAPERLFGRQIPVPGGLDVTFREPIGVVGVIVPWNFPMPIAGWGFAPALAAGNTVVLKPASLTPLTALRLAARARRRVARGRVPGGAGRRGGRRPAPGRPPRRGQGRLHRLDRGRPADHGRLRGPVKRLTLELGGKSANIVFADADLERAAASAPMAVFDNAGQDCCARSRILVERAAYDRFMELLEVAVGRVRVGDPAAADTDMGRSSRPATAGGWRRSCPRTPPSPSRATPPRAHDYWFPPTVLAPVATIDPAYTEEVFEPVVAVVPFDDEAEAVRLANDTPYGLSGSIWTENVGRAAGGRSVETGNLSVNSRVGAVLDALRRLQALGPGPRAGARRPRRLHRGEERVHRHRARWLTEEPAVGRLQDRVVVVTGGAGSAWRRPAGWRWRAPAIVIGDLDPATGDGGGRGRRPVRRRRRGRRRAQVEALFHAAADAYGSVDVAFNNAGISPPEDDSLLVTDLDVWRRVQEVNLTSVFLCCKHAIPHMRRAGRARSSTPPRSWR